MSSSGDAIFPKNIIFRSSEEFSSTQGLVDYDSNLYYRGEKITSVTTPGYWNLEGSNIHNINTGNVGISNTLTPYLLTLGTPYFIGFDDSSNSMVFNDVINIKSTLNDKNSIQIGYQAGNQDQGDSTVAIGNQAGYQGQNNYSVAIGYLAGRHGQQTQDGTRPMIHVAGIKFTAKTIMFIRWIYIPTICRATSPNHWEI